MRLGVTPVKQNLARPQARPQDFSAVPSGEPLVNSAVHSDGRVEERRSGRAHPPSGEVVDAPSAGSPAAPSSPGGALGRGGGAGRTGAPGTGGISNSS